MKTTIKKRAFEHVSTYPGSTATQVAHAIHEKPSSVSSALNKLTKTGTLARKENIGPKGGTGYYIPQQKIELAKQHEHKLKMTLKRAVELTKDASVGSFRNENKVAVQLPDGRVHFPDFVVTAPDCSVTRLEDVVVDTCDFETLKACVTYANERGYVYKLHQQELLLKHVAPKASTYENRYGTFKRPTFESIFMDMALQVSARSTCLRKHVGTVITDAKMERVLCYGYNGGVTGDTNCCDTLEVGNCGCIHSEVSAMTKSVVSLEDACCFVSLSPCLACAKLLCNRGVSRVVYYEQYRNTDGIELLDRHNIRVEQY